MHSMRDTWGHTGDRGARHATHVCVQAQETWPCGRIRSSDRRLRSRRPKATVQLAVACFPAQRRHRDPPDHEHRTLPQGSRSPSLLLLPSHLLTFFRTSLGPSLPELTSAHRPARPTARPCLSLFQAESTVALAHLLASHAGAAWTQ